MRFSRQEPGLIISSVAHAAVLVAGLVAFASAPPFADQQESVAVDLVTDAELSAMTHGDKTAKEVKPDPKPRVDKVAELNEEKPQSADAPRDVPAPPARPPAPEPVEKAQETPPPSPPPREAAQPQPEPPKPEPPKLDPPPRPPEPKPEPPKEAEVKPEPPKRPEPPKPEPPKPVEKKPEPKKEDLAKLIEQSEEKKPQPKPTEPERKFNPADIRKLLESKDKAQASASTGREVNRTASAGTQTGNAPKLSMSQMDAIGALIRDQINRCFSAPPGVEGVKIKPMVRMVLNPDGSLAGEPTLANTSSGDPAFRSFAESLTRAIRRCAPYHIPPQYAPYYADWRNFNVIADPRDFLG